MSQILGGLPAATVVLAVVLGLVGLIAAMALFARNYIKVPPSRSRSSTAASTRSSTTRGAARKSGSASCGAARRSASR